jgi:hypothetical protein
MERARDVPTRIFPAGPDIENCWRAAGLDLRNQRGGTD